MNKYAIFGALSAMCNTVGLSDKLIGSTVSICSTRSQDELTMLSQLSQLNPSELEMTFGMVVELHDMPAPMQQRLAPAFMSRIEDLTANLSDVATIQAGREYTISGIDGQMLLLTDANGATYKVHKGLLTLKNGVSLNGETGHMERYRVLRELIPMTERVILEIDDTWGSTLADDACDLVLGRRLNLSDVPAHDRHVINMAINAMSQIDARVLCEGLAKTSDPKNTAQMAAHGLVTAATDELRHQLDALATPTAVDLLRDEWTIVSIDRGDNQVDFKTATDNELRSRFTDMTLRADDGTVIRVPSGVVFYKGATFDGQTVESILN